MKNFVCLDLELFLLGCTKTFLLTVRKSFDAYFKRNISMMIISLLPNPRVSFYFISGRLLFYCVLCFIRIMHNSGISRDTICSNRRKSLPKEVARSTCGFSDAKLIALFPINALRPYNKQIQLRYVDN